MLDPGVADIWELHTHTGNEVAFTGDVLLRSLRALRALAVKLSLLTPVYREDTKRKLRHYLFFASFAVAGKVIFQIFPPLPPYSMIYTSFPTITASTGSLKPSTMRLVLTK